MGEVTAKIKPEHLAILGILQMLLESFSKCTEGLPYVFLITHKLPTLEPVDSPTLLLHGVLALGRYQHIFNCPITSEVGLYVHYGLGLSDGPNASGVLVVGAVVPLTGKLSYSSFHYVHGPSRILAFIKWLPEVVHLFVKKFQLTVYCSTPVGEGINNTLCGQQVVVAVPLQILICVDGLPKHCDK